jgi:hypothetical protein
VILNLPEGGTDNAELIFSEGGLDLAASTSANEPILLTIAKGSKASVVTPSGNPAKLTLTATPATGAFKGGFTLSETVPLTKPTVVTRKVAFQGVIIRETDETYRGYGYFLLPQLPDNSTPVAKTPILSGQVILQPSE